MRGLGPSGNGLSSRNIQRMPNAPFSVGIVMSMIPPFMVSVFAQEFRRGDGLSSPAHLCRRGDGLSSPAWGWVRADEDKPSPLRYGSTGASSAFGGSSVSRYSVPGSGLSG